MLLSGLQHLLSVRRLLGHSAALWCNVDLQTYRKICRRLFVRCLIYANAKCLVSVQEAAGMSLLEMKDSFHILSQI